MGIVNQLEQNGGVLAIGYLGYRQPLTAPKRCIKSRIRFREKFRRTDLHLEIGLRIGAIGFGPGCDIGAR